MTLAEQLLVDSGLGTCWAGYLCRMVNQCEELRTQLGLPENHQVYGVLMTGIPNETYPSVPARPAAAVNWVE
jgi:nitroreductase